MKTIEIDNHVCKFDPSNHTYEIDGDKVHSVTQITDIVDKGGALMWWSLNHARDYIIENMEPGREYDEIEIEELAKEARLAHRKQSGKATTIGSLVHSYIEDWVKYELDQGEEPDIPVNKEARQSIEAFEDWEDRNEIEWINTEQITFHPELKYAGTYDAGCRIDDLTFVVDWKTSKGIYPEYMLQCEAYRRAEMELLGEDIDGIIVARFPKDEAGFENVIVTDPDLLDRHWQAFRSALRLKRWKEDMSDYS